VTPDTVFEVQGCSKNNPLMELTVLPQITVITITFCCNYLCRSKFVTLEKPGKLGKLVSYIVTTL